MPDRFVTVKMQKGDRFAFASHPALRYVSRRHG